MDSVKLLECIHSLSGCDYHDGLEGRWKLRAGLGGGWKKKKKERRRKKNRELKRREKENKWGSPFGSTCFFFCSGSGQVFENVTWCLL